MEVAVPVAPVAPVPPAAPALEPETTSPSAPLDADAPPTNDDSANKENEVTTVAPEFLIKHPLQNVWTLWYFEPVKGDWQSGQKEITSIDTVEDFWSIYNHIKLASELKQGCDYSLFKQGISPMWEDTRNKDGGRWLLTLEKRHRANDLDKLWLDVCLSLIGEAFKHADDICGSIVNIRPKQDKISLWTSDCTNNAKIMELGRDFKENLKIRLPVQYITHKDQMKAGSTTKFTCTL